MKKRRLIIYILTAVLIESASINTFAQRPVKHSTALDFVDYVSSTCDAGFAGAGLVSTNDIAWAASDNIAAIPFSDKKFDAAVSYLLWNADCNSYIALGASGKIKEKFAVSIGATAGFDPELKSTYNMQINGGFAWKFIPIMSAGINLRYANQCLLGNYKMSSVMADIYLMSKISDFSLSAGISNLGTKAGLDKGDKYKVPGAFRLGFGYTPLFAEKHLLEVYLDGKYSIAGLGFSASGGLGYSFNDIISLRTGYCYGGKIIANHASAGIGFKIAGIHLDAAYIITKKESPIANSFSIGLGYSF